MAKDKNYVSFWFWLIAIILITLPCVGIIFIFIFAFMGENDSRKNFFKAALAFHAIAIGIFLSVFALGAGPKILEAIVDSTEKWPPFLRGQ